MDVVDGEAGEGLENEVDVVDGEARERPKNELDVVGDEAGGRLEDGEDVVDGKADNKLVCQAGVASFELAGPWVDGNSIPSNLGRVPMPR